jgi:hypothetical protein
VRPGLVIYVLFALCPAAFLAGCSSGGTATSDQSLALTHFSVSPGTLFPDFTSGQTTYLAIVDDSVASVQVEARVSGRDAEVKIGGVCYSGPEATSLVDLDGTETVISVELTDSTGVVFRSYILLVVREIRNSFCQPATPSAYECFCDPGYAGSPPESECAIAD